MESLYRKYRPQTFDDVVGQQHVVSTLEHAVLEGRTSHAYLFCGPHGTGKTTMARLLAKALMCEQGPGHLPDGTCEQCRAIAAGEHPDVYELDAASRTGVDNVREEIINRVSYAPVQGSHKVYIIDEVHMLTTAAFNALLKTLEEPPAHVVFVLCTTDPQKVPETILSRVQRFDFHAISNDELLARLEYVCRQEDFEYDAEALALVARHARGGMRDALSTLEQLSVFGDGKVTLEAAQDLLGEVATSTLSDVSAGLARRDVPALFQVVGELTDAGHDLLQFSRELAAHLRDVYVVAAVGPKPGVVNATGEELAQLGAEAKAFGSPDRLARALGIIGDASSEMRTATNQRLVLELAFAKIARPESELTLEALAERVDVLERQVRALSAPGRIAPPAPSVPAPAPASASVPAPAPASAPASASVPMTAPAPAPAVAAPQQTAQPPVRQSAPQQRPMPAPQASGAGAIQDPGELQRRWRQVVDGLRRSAPARGSLLMNATAEADTGTELVIDLHQSSSFTLKMLQRPDVAETVGRAVAEVFGRRHLSFKDGGATSVPAPAPRSAPAPTPAPQPQPVAPAPALTPQAPADDDRPPIPDEPIYANDQPFDGYGAPAPSFVSAPSPAPRPVAPAAQLAPSSAPFSPAPGAAADSQPEGEPAGFDPTDAASVMAMLTSVFGEGVTDRSNG